MRTAPRRFSAICLTLALFAGCTREASEPSLPLGRPALSSAGLPAAASMNALEISARLPGIAPWKVRLERSGGAWMTFSRSDRPQDRELADSKLVDHLLEVLDTFATEAEAGKAPEGELGFNPYRVEFRVPGAPRPLLELGEASGPNGVAFRVAGGKKIWIGRGALLAFLPAFEKPDAFSNKLPYALDFDAIDSVRLEKTAGKGRGAWEFLRAGDEWFARESKGFGKKPLPAEKAAILERVFHQRLLALLPISRLPDLAHPDWRITVRNQSGREEMLELLFAQNNVFGFNPVRSNRSLQLYPEFAGSLRAFTQARFTPLKSGTKK
ncbi:MAG: hypothetical protein JST04_18280 [Bdellovibrionales bacterium]|nr:hypothetical protein [Bdellovibrionales bacterium]